MLDFDANLFHLFKHNILENFSSPISVEFFTQQHKSKNVTVAIYNHTVAEFSYLTSIRRDGSEEIPLVQGKRNPSKTVGVARGHQRADALKPYSQKTS